MAEGGQQLHTMTAHEFVRRVAQHAGEADTHYVLWLGAGCSVTSGIAAAAALVRDNWLPRLHRLRAPRRPFEDWVSESFSEYEPAAAGSSYGAVMNQLFPLADERQRETERLCDGRAPGFGYAVLASLMSRDDGILSAALTTNFDDLVADAMYVFGDRRPLVVQHHSLAGFARPGRVRRPVVVKVHGDHRLNPMHTAIETAQLDEEVAESVRGLLRDRGVIFIGYAGNDQGVIKVLKGLPQDALPLGVSWVSRNEPQGAIRPWLESRGAFWVKADGFDELMLLFREEFKIEHPTARKFDAMVDAYRRTYESLSTRVKELPESAVDAGALKQAADRAAETAPEWWGVELAAQAVQETDPERADEIYRQGVERLNDHRLQLNYANFLTDVLGQHDRAQEFYERSLAADPTNSITLGAFAQFLTEVRADHSRAEELFERAASGGAGDASTLGNYANFLVDVRGAYDRARAMYERATAADPAMGNNFANYSRLLFETGDDSRALEAAERALALEVTRLDTRAEVLFYLAAVGPPERSPAALAELAGLVKSGVRSPGWDLSRIVARARERGRADVDWLGRLADVISKGAPAESLDDWPEWPNG